MLKCLNPRKNGLNFFLFQKMDPAGFSQPHRRDLPGEVGKRERKEIRKVVIVG
jgi:hypothetical protein